MGEARERRSVLINGNCCKMEMDQSGRGDFLYALHDLKLAKASLRLAGMWRAVEGMGEPTQNHSNSS